jgi:hypothetical protein
MTPHERLRFPFLFAGFLLAGLVFLFLFTFLAVFNRPAADDYYFLSSVHQAGVLHTTWQAYSTWITRWSTLLFLGGMIRLLPGLTDSLFPVLTFGILVVAATAWVRRAVYLASGRTVRWPLAAVYGLLAAASLFLFSIRPGESFFWFTSSCMYLWPFIVLLFGLYLLMYRRHLMVAGLMACAFLFIGGGSEVIALESLLLLLAMYGVHRRSPGGAETMPAMAIAVISLAASLLLAWLGPGRALRQEALPAFSASLLALPLKSAAYFLLTQLPVKLHWMVLFLLPWMVLRKLFQPEATATPPQVFRKIGLSAGAFLLFVVMHYGITVFLLRSYPPYRTTLTVTAGLVLLCASTGWRLGALLPSPRAVRITGIVFIVVSLLLFAELISNVAGTAPRYAQAVDARMKELALHSGEGGITDVAPLPPAGLLYSAEISSDTAHFSNRFLKRYLHLQGAVRKKAD